MYSVFVPILYFSLTWISMTQAQIPAHTCPLIKNTNYFRLSIEDYQCIFTDLNLSDSTTNFNIKTQVPLPNITSLEVRSSNIPSVTSIWCSQLPYIQQILMYSNKIQEIVEDAFVPCVQLKFIDLSENQLKNIPQNIFAHNTNLMEIVIAYNDLVSIHPDQFRGLVNLTLLRLTHNSIKEFSFNLLRDLKQIRIVELYKNSLYDLDVETVTYMSAPFLERVAFENDNFLCERYRNMKLYFETALKIRVTEPSAALETDQQAKCLDEQSWIQAVKQSTDWPAELIISKVVKNQPQGVYNILYELHNQKIDLDYRMIITNRFVDQFMDKITLINAKLGEQASHDKNISFYFTTIIALLSTLITLSLATCLIMYMNKGTLKKGIARVEKKEKTEGRTQVNEAKIQIKPPILPKPTVETK